MTKSKELTEDEELILQLQSEEDVMDMIDDILTERMSLEGPSIF